jgi:hypothetical protein
MGGYGWDNISNGRNSGRIIIIIIIIIISLVVVIIIRSTILCTTGVLDTIGTNDPILSYT